MISEKLTLKVSMQVLQEFDFWKGLRKVNSRLWLEKADWTSWANTLEDLSKDIMEIDDCNKIWSRIKQSISEASDNFIPTETSCHHSKPFWNADISAASKDIRKCREQFSLKSNYSNGLALASAKKHFKSSLALEASSWMQSLSREFGYKTGKDFWKTYNRLLLYFYAELRSVKTIKDQMYFVCVSRIKTIRLMYTKYNSMLSSLFVNNLLGSLCFCRGHSESTPYNISSCLTELF